ncbi:MAG TPA: phosphotransferase [Arachidicoccus sp.]|nr:phosphotransferase [Arachidicoccus sp.]
MIESSVKDAFNFPGDIAVEKLSTGLINHTYKTTFPNGEVFLLQSINTKVFTQPLVIQQNYLKIKQHFESAQSYILPAILRTTKGKLLYEDNGYVWRCFEFIKDTYSPTVSSTADEAWLVAGCFGNFSAKLSDLEVMSIQTVLQGFHDLSLRFAQFSASLEVASEDRKKAAQVYIKTALEQEHLVTFYEKVQQQPAHFPLHILHHDCKIANILFRKSDQKIYSPIDLDTTQPGLFFSDIGDMIRSMVPNHPEDYPHIEALALREDFYEAVRDGYLMSMSQFLTKEEIQHIDMSGKIIVFMQALRFLTDYLNNDIYYQTSYSSQNLDRAANQFRLLELLINYVEGHDRKQRKIYIGQ